MVSGPDCSAGGGQSEAQEGFCRPTLPRSCCSAGARPSHCARAWNPTALAAAETSVRGTGHRLESRLVRQAASRPSAELLQRELRPHGPVCIAAALDGLTRSARRAPLTGERPISAPVIKYAVALQTVPALSCSDLKDPQSHAIGGRVGFGRGVDMLLSDRRPAWRRLR